jgi:hypothetical protein
MKAIREMRDWEIKDELRRGVAPEMAAVLRAELERRYQRRKEREAAKWRQWCSLEARARLVG